MNVDKLKNHCRHGITFLLLLSHLMQTVGFPIVVMEAPTGSSYPCQNRQCGCTTSQQCWQGDCCCFTLEEKLDWAERNQIEPPEHVRPLVAERQSKARSLQCNTCCHHTEDTSGLTAACPAEGCCHKPAMCKNCVSKAEKDQSCKHCKADSRQAKVQWIIGLFSKKCRGIDHSEFNQGDPLHVPLFLEFPVSLPTSEPVSVFSESLKSVSHRPIIPPPRFQ